MHVKQQSYWYKTCTIQVRVQLVQWLNVPANKEVCTHGSMQVCELFLLFKKKVACLTQVLFPMHALYMHDIKNIHY